MVYNDLNMTAEPVPPPEYRPVEDIDTTVLKPVSEDLYRTPNQLKQLLESYNIWDTDWKEDNLRLLWSDLHTGSKQLVATNSRDKKTEGLALIMEIISADVLHYDAAGHEYQLQEDWHALVTFDRQTKTGSVERKQRQKARALSEKIEPGESVPEALDRAIKQELGLDPGNCTSDILESRWESRFSPSYPRLQNLTQVHICRILLNDKRGGGIPFESHVEEESVPATVGPEQTKVVRFSWKSKTHRAIQDWAESK